MTPTHYSPRGFLLLTELNRRGIKGGSAKLILRKYAQERIARQIDYHDHEVSFKAGLPLWAGTPWLAHRIRKDLPEPEGYFPASHSVAAFLRAVRYRAK